MDTMTRGESPQTREVLTQFAVPTEVQPEGVESYPLKSEVQRRWMHAAKPKMAEEWEGHTPKGKKLPERVKKHQLLLGVYAKDKELARMMAARMGIDINTIALQYGIRGALTGWELGVKHGKEEAGGIRPPPGALKLWLLQLLHGDAYTMGRQHSLTQAGFHGGTRARQGVLEVVAPVVQRLAGTETV